MFPICIHKRNISKLLYLQKRNCFIVSPPPLPPPDNIKLLLAILVFTYVSYRKR